MEKSFKELGVSSPILKAIEDMGYQMPTEVQEMAIPTILDKQDVIVISKTGSGKTAVFGIPILQLTDSESIKPEALIITPTRELAVQVDNDLKQIGKYLPHKTTAVYGQHNINTEIRTLKQGVSIITGTPGRIYDHIQHKNITTDNIRFLVLDEADRMLDMGFIDQVKQIIKRLPKDRVTLLFSATVPTEVRNICKYYMKNPSTLEVASQTKTVDAIEQEYYHVEANEKRTQLERLLIVQQPESCIIFCNTRFAVDKIQSFLSRKGFVSKSLHGDIPQNRRLQVIQQFKDGALPILVATDVAARGIHIEGLSLVINYDLPESKDNYVHRIGRTGRAGSVGKAINLVTGEDIMTLYEIEEHIGTMIEEKELPSEALYRQKLEEFKRNAPINILTKSPESKVKKKYSSSPKTSKTPTKGSFVPRDKKEHPKQVQPSASANSNARVSKTMPQTNKTTKVSDLSSKNVTATSIETTAAPKTTIFQRIKKSLFGK